MGKLTMSDNTYICMFSIECDYMLKVRNYLKNNWENVAFYK